MAGRGYSERSIRRQTSAYRALLVLFPASFRGEFGVDMVQVFGDRLRYDGQAAAISPLRMWTTTLVDVAVTATRLRMEALMKPGSERVPLVIALFLLAGVSVVAVNLGGILAGLPLAVFAVAGLALYRSDVAKLLRRPADPTASGQSVPRRLLAQAWWAPFATAMALVEICLEPYYAIFGDQDLAGVLIGGVIFTGLGVLTLLGLLRRPGNRPLGNTLVLVGTGAGFTAPWMVWPPILAGLIWVGVLTSGLTERRRPAVVVA
jgi:hypothetical protein